MCRKVYYLPISLTSSLNPKAKPFPQGSQGSWVWCYTPTTKQTQPPLKPAWKSRLSLLSWLEGNTAAWIHLSQFMQLWWVCTWNLTCWRFFLCFFINHENQENTEMHQTITNNHRHIQSSRFLFKNCYISVRDGHTVLLVQTLAIPSSQSGDANYKL